MNQNNIVSKETARLVILARRLSLVATQYSGPVGEKLANAAWVARETARLARQS